MSEQASNRRAWNAGARLPRQPADAPSSDDLIPVRMLNEYAYCLRLFHLMHVGGRWEDNEYTEEGREVHRRRGSAGP